MAFQHHIRSSLDGASLLLISLRRTCIRPFKIHLGSHDRHVVSWTRMDGLAQNGLGQKLPLKRITASPMPKLHTQLVQAFESTKAVPNISRSLHALPGHYKSVFPLQQPGYPGSTSEVVTI